MSEEEQGTEQTGVRFLSPHVPASPGHLLLLPAAFPLTSSLWHCPSPGSARLPSPDLGLTPQQSLPHTPIP